MATINKRGNSWILNWSEGGRQFRRSLGSISRDKAEKVLKIKKAELETGEKFFRGVEPSRVTLNNFAPDYLAWHKSEHPASHTRIAQIVDEHILPVFGTRQLGAVEPRETERWKGDRLTAGAAPGTVGKELRTLKAMLNKAVSWGLIDSHKIASVKAPKELDDRPPPYYTKDQLQAIYEASSKHGAVWQFMANTGLRRSEMMRATRQDISGGVLRVLSTAKARTKSGRWRQIPLSPGALDALDSLGPDNLCPRMTGPSLSRAFRNDAAKAGAGGSIHWLRHTFCSHLVMNGVNLRTVQELAGHASYQTTLNYAHLSAGHLSDAVKGLKL